MHIIRSRNLIIHLREDRINTEAVIACHGRYTRRRLLVLPGSGTVRIPEGLEVRFYTDPGLTCIGPRAHWGIVNDNGFQGLPFHPHTDEVVTNYSLHHHPNTMGYPAEDQSRDVILVAEEGKAHLSDVFDVIEAYELPYTVLHNFHCRVERRFQFRIEHNT